MNIQIATCLLSLALLPACSTTQTTAQHQTLEQRLMTKYANAETAAGEPAPGGDPRGGDGRALHALTKFELIDREISRKLPWRLGLARSPTDGEIDMTTETYVEHLVGLDSMVVGIK